MSSTERRRLSGPYVLVFSGCMFAIAGLAQFIHPGGWQIWAALAFLALGVWCAVNGMALLYRDEPQTDLCSCLKFHFWYAEDGHQVCRCGHPDGEHLDRVRSCVGTVEAYRA